MIPQCPPRKPRKRLRPFQIMKNKVSKSVDFANRFSRSGVSPDIEQLLPAGETPALLSRNHKAIRFRHHITAFFLILAAFPIAIAHAQQFADQSAGFTPQPGAPLRTALMDAIRFHDFYKTRELARSNPEKIVFKVQFLRVSGDWALVNVLPLKHGKDFAEPRWNLIHLSGGEWQVVDHLDKIRHYYNDDAEFFGALDMDPTAVARLQKEMPQLPKDIFPKQ